MQQTYLFYDIETSGLNKCFDQVMQFAAIRTDLELNELERYNFFVKLNPDVVPTPQAILTHKISLSKLDQEGICEYEAAKLIHKLFNTPCTTSIGYNTLGFDDEFLRFTFYRNLLPPYTHQHANCCNRIDLYPITTVYYLFHQEVLNWPKIDNIPTLKLEHLSTSNQLITDKNANAHDAMTDVIATLELARRLYKKQAIWQYLCKFFDKKEDAKRYDKLNIGLNIEDYLYPDALLIDGSIGAKKSYQTVALALGWHKHYNNQLLWLDLERADLANTTMNNIATATFVYRKKLGEPPLILPTIPRLLHHIGSERSALIKKNLTWLHQNPQVFQAIIKYHQEYTYPLVINLDIDAALYQDGFLSESDQQLCLKFHAADLQGKINLLPQFTNPKLRVQAMRLLGRNYFSQLPEQLSNEFKIWLKQINSVNIDVNDKNCSDNAISATRDYRGEPRLTSKQALDEIQKIVAICSDTPLRESSSLLAELEKYYLQKMSTDAN